MAGEFGSGPLQPDLPFGHIDILQPLEAPEDYDERQLRKVVAKFWDLKKEHKVRISVIHDVGKSPTSYLVRIIGTKTNVHKYIRALGEISFEELA